MEQEFSRFLNMWGCSMHRFGKIINQSTESSYRNVPIKTTTNFLGDRVGEIMIDTLVRHLVVAERHWFKSLAKIEDGATIPKPEGIVANADLTYQNAAQFYIDEVGNAFKDLKNINIAQLEKKIKWSGNTFTVMGFLWAIFTHHTYHLGQIDLLLRQHEIYPLDIFDPKALGSEGVLG